MEIELTHGCNCEAFEADGNNVYKLPDELLLAMLSLMARKISFKWRECELEDWRRIELAKILSDMVEHFPDKEEHSNKPCECCGDYVETYTMEI